MRLLFMYALVVFLLLNPAGHFLFSYVHFLWLSRLYPCICLYVCLIMFPIYSFSYHGLWIGLSYWIFIVLSAISIYLAVIWLLTKSIIVFQTFVFRVGCVFRTCICPRRAGNITPKIVKIHKYSDLIDCLMVLPIYICKFDAKKHPTCIQTRPRPLLKAPGPESTNKETTP